jgi:hypothetical protein
VISPGKIPATLATAKRAATTAAHPWRTASVKTAAATAAVKATAATAAVEATTTATTMTASAMLSESSARNADERDRQKRREKKL